MAAIHDRRSTPKPSPPAWPRKAAFAVGGIWILGYLFLLGRLFLHEDPVERLAGMTGFDWMVLLGGPCTLILWTLLAIWWEKPAGGVLWLGAAAAALGFSFRAGPHLGEYLFGLFTVVIPQAVEGSLFLFHARRRDLAVKKKRRRIISR